jgi:prepilin-type N-terminal cleavage/methylation domain-containing protein
VSDERGFTLIETLVTLGLMSIAMVIAFAFIDNVTSISSRASNDVIAEDNLRLALRTLTEDIRAASPPTITFTGPASTCPTASTPGTCISFTIVRDTSANPSCQSVITYGLLGSALKESRTDTGCATNLTMTGKTISSSVVNGTTPLFSYYDKQGNPLTSGQESAGSVGIVLLVQYQTNSPILSLSTYASLRNAR